MGFFNLLLLEESCNFSLLRVQLDNSSLVFSSVLLGLLDLLSLELKFSVALLSLFKCILLLYGHLLLLEVECILGFLRGQCSSGFSFICLNFSSKRLLRSLLFCESGGVSFNLLS